MMKFDTYTIKARLLPVLIVMLPAILASISWFPELETTGENLWSLAVSAGIPALLAQLGRDRGKKKQAGLFQSWGGAPSVVNLRYSASSNEHYIKRLHSKLQTLLGDSPKLPTPEEEAADPDSADEIYETCSRMLRDRTRDKDRFYLLFSENCNFGFRRNLWGLKPLGLVILSMSILATALLASTYVSQGLVLPVSIYFVFAIQLFLLVLWIFVIKPAWIRVAADGCVFRRIRPLIPAQTGHPIRF